MTLVRLFVVFGGVIVLSLFTLLIGPYFIDWSDYRSDFEREASRILGQKVVVKGAPSLRLLPFPSVTFTQLEIGENQNGLPMMLADTFEMDLEITPLLSGEILVFDMRVDQPRVTVTILEDGTLDWALSHQANLSGNNVVLEQVNITGGEIVVLDLQNQRTERISDINALLSAPEISGPWQISGSAVARQAPVRYAITTGAVNDAGRMRLRGRLISELFPMALELEGDAEIIDNRPSYRGGFSIQKLADKNVLNTPLMLRPLLTMQMKGDFALTNQSIDVPNYRFLSGDLNDPYIVEGSALLVMDEEPRFELVAKGQQVDVGRLNGINQADGSTNTSDPNSDSTNVTNPVPLGQSGFEYAMELINRIPIPQIEGVIDLSLPAIVAGDTTIRDLELTARPINGGWRLEQANAKLPGRTNIEARGDLRLAEPASFRGDLIIASQQPSGFSSWLIGRVDPEIRQMAVAGLSASVILNQDIQLFDKLELILGSTAIKGTAERQLLRNGTPAISLNLEGPELRIDRVMALLNLVNFGQDITEGGQLYRQNIVANVKTDLLAFGDMMAENVETVFQYNSGDLTLQKLSFSNFLGMSGGIQGQINNLDDKPTGNIEFSGQSQEARALWQFMTDFDPQHPLTAQLSSNISAYSDLTFDGQMTIDEAHNVGMDIKGSVNGSDFRFNGNGQALLPFLFDDAANPLDIELSVQNRNGGILLAQMGFETLPLDFEDAGALNLQLSRGIGHEMQLISDFAYGETRVTLQGDITYPEQVKLSEATGAFDLSVSSSDIEPLIYTLGQTLPRLGTGLPLDLVADLTVNGSTISLDHLKGRSDANQFQGRLAMDRANANYNATGALQLSELDFDWLYEFTLGVPLISLSDDDWSKAQYVPPFTAAPRTDLTLSADKAFVGQLDTISNFQAQLVSAPGSLDVKDLKGRWHGGDLKGELSISNPDGQAFGRFSGVLKGADIASLTEHDTHANLLSGKIDMKGNLEGTGHSFFDMVQSVNGGGEYAIKDLEIKNFQPDIFQDILDNVDRGLFDINADTVQSTANVLSAKSNLFLDELTIPFSVTGGVQRISAIDIERDLYRLNGQARIDLVGRSIGAQLDVFYDAQLEAQQGASAELSYQFNGPFSQPKRILDVSAMTNFLSIRAYERERRRVELLQASILEKQRLRREIALVRDQQLRREEQARLKAEEEARRKAEEEAKRQAELEAQLAAEAEAQRLADEAIARAQAEKQAAEAQAQKLAEEAIERAKQRAQEEEAERRAEAILEQRRKAQQEAEQTTPPDQPDKTSGDETNDQTNNKLVQSIEDILNRPQSVTTGDNIEVIDLDAPVSQ